MIAFFGCRPCLLFDTRAKFNNSENDGSGEPIKHATATQRANIGKQSSSDVYMDDTYDTKSCSDGDVMAVRSNYIVGNESSSTRESESDRDSNSDSDSDSGSVYNSGEDGDTDDNYDTGLVKTRSFLYKHFTISIVPNPTSGKPNMVFNNLRM